jgi:hypothetical protein
MPMVPVVERRRLDAADSAQYLSDYRRVLDHFDALRVGLSAAG